MTFRDHQPGEPSPFHPGSSALGTIDCIWCCEPWPCPTRKVVEEVAEFVFNSDEECMCGYPMQEVFSDKILGKELT